MHVYVSILQALSNNPHLVNTLVCFCGKFRPLFFRFCLLSVMLGRGGFKISHFGPFHVKKRNFFQRRQRTQHLRSE